jgi:hypothetical protein
MVQQCDIYQQAKEKKVAYLRFQPLPAPRGTWKDMMMDLIEGLLKS